jgi:hypothetical protein
LPVLSQTSDTSKVVLNKRDALRVLAKGYEAKALEQQRDLLLNQVDTLKARIAIKDGIILNKDGQISDYRNIVSSKDAIISTQGEQRKIWEANIASLNKEVKRQRRQKKLTAFVGILTTGIAVYFALK